MLSHTQRSQTTMQTRTFGPSNYGDTSGRNGVHLTLDERALLDFGKDRGVEFFDSARNRSVRAVMASNRAPFLS